MLVLNQNPTQAGGEIKMDSHGTLSLTDFYGAGGSHIAVALIITVVFYAEVFTRVPRENGAFSLQSSTNTRLFLALSRDYTVRGMVSIHT